MSIVLPEHKCSLTISHNKHKDYYESLEDYYYDVKDEIGLALYKECIEEDSIWEMQWYPETPIGFYIIYSTTFEGLFSEYQRIFNP